MSKCTIAMHHSRWPDKVYEQWSKSKQASSVACLCVLENEEEHASVASPPMSKLRSGFLTMCSSCGTFLDYICILLSVWSLVSG